jgi:hypothetical protein
MASKYITEQDLERDVAGVHLALHCVSGIIEINGVDLNPEEAHQLGLALRTYSAWAKHKREFNIAEVERARAKVGGRA